jgi:hypothetical protein
MRGSGAALLCWSLSTVLLLGVPAGNTHTHTHARTHAHTQVSLARQQLRDPHTVLAGFVPSIEGAALPAPARRGDRTLPPCVWRRLGLP